MSLSPDTIQTSWPSADAFLASVPMTSSASKPGTAMNGKPMPSTARRIHASCGTSSSGILSRVAL